MAQVQHLKTRTGENLPIADAGASLPGSLLSADTGEMKACYSAEAVGYHGTEAREAASAKPA